MKIPHLECEYVLHMIAWVHHLSISITKNKKITKSEKYCLARVIATTLCMYIFQSDYIYYELYSYVFLLL